LSESIAQGGGFGVSSILQQQLAPKQSASPVKSENKESKQ
jgi:Rod binding domain-containing protein